MSEGERFIENLRDAYDPEKKREIIGHTFLDTQHDFFTEHDLHENWLLAQGTIYPDTIETGGTKHASKIKTHHNRAPEVQKLIDAGKIIEPIKELYKDEVRKLGEFLGLPSELVWRHPFPGPGLGVRILCNDNVITNECKRGEKEGEYTILPIRSVGVQGDFRTYKHPAILKRVEKKADDPFFLEKLEERATDFINHNSEINRCVVMLGSNFEGDIEKIYVEKMCINPERVARLQRADGIVTRILGEQKLYSKIWQFPTVLLPVSFNGTGIESIVLRPIDSIDAMSASVGKLPEEFFQDVVAEILKDDSISAVFLDVTSKPPGTIEWE